MLPWGCTGYFFDLAHLAFFVSLLFTKHSTARGSVLGAILGAAYPDSIRFVKDLCASQEIENEIKALVGTI